MLETADVASATTSGALEVMLDTTFGIFSTLDTIFGTADETVDAVDVIADVVDAIVDTMDSIESTILENCCNNTSICIFIYVTSFVTDLVNLSIPSKVLHNRL
jgi:hypothetical protein